jgi:hypothetical protein
VGGLRLRWGELSGNRVDRDWWVGQGLMGRTRADGWGQGLVARIRSAGLDTGYKVGQRLVGITRSCGSTGAGGWTKPGAGG